MSELKRGLISVGILVLVISIIYLVIQNYREQTLSWFKPTSNRN